MKGTHRKPRDMQAVAHTRRVIAIVAAVALLVGGTYGVIASGLGGRAVSTVQSWWDNVTKPTEPPTTSAPSSSTSASTTTTTVPSQNTTDSQETPTDTPRVPGNYARPDLLKGVTLQAGVDFLVGKQDGKTVKAELDAVFTQLETWQFNTVFLPVTDKSGRALYNDGADGLNLTDEGGAPFSLFDYAVTKAHEKEMYVYLIVDLGVTDGTVDPRVAKQTETLGKRVSTLLAKARPDGFLLTGYTVDVDDDATTQGTLSERYAALTKTAVTRMMTQVTDIIKEVNNNYYVGILSEETPVTADGQAPTLTAGHACVSEWITSGLVDFVMADIPASMESGFETRMSAWDTLCQDTDTYLYIRHSSANTVSKKTGWTSPDQLTKQVLACRKKTTYKGSSFDSLVALKADTGKCTTVLLTAFEGTVQTQFIANQLNVTKPSKLTFTTKESQLSFGGSADPNFPLIINGKEVEVTKRGYFAWNTSLKLGENVIKIEHKGKTRTYRVTYELTVIDSVYPDKSAQYEEGTEIQLSTVARAGSTVYAMVGNTRVNMEVTRVESEENNNQIPTDFETYMGAYTIPDGKIGSAVSLGNITFHATYQGQKVTKTGGALSVAAVTTTTTTTTTTTATTTTTTPSGTTGTTGGTASSSQAGAPSIPSALTPLSPTTGSQTLVTGQQVVTVNPSFAMTSAPEKPGYNRPDYSFLPRGTMDVVTKQIVSGGVTYYQLGCGKVIQKSYVTQYADKSKGKLTANTFKSNTVAVSPTHTVVTLGSTWRVPYNLTVAPQSYPYKNSQYNFQISAQTMTYIDVKFYYTTAVPSAPNVEGSPLFKKAEWIKGADNTYTLRLHLKKTGEFYGYSVAWDADGDLTFAFKHPFAVGTGNKPLTGVTIVVDPGHGGSTGGAKYPAADGSYTTETILVMQYSEELQKQLKAKGANVVMTRTNNKQCPELEDRVQFARNNNTDLFISVHMDAFDGTARGGSVHYFNEYSYNFAKSVFAGMKAAYGKHDSYAQIRGAKWNSFHVVRLHDCPAVLLECGFLDNPKDREILTTPAFIKDFCTGVVDGVINYYKTVTLEKVTASTTTTSATDTTDATVTATALSEQNTTEAS